MWTFQFDLNEAVVKKGGKIFLARSVPVRALLKHVRKASEAVVLFGNHLQSCLRSRKIR